jgi:hypothetical protein
MLLHWLFQDLAVLHPDYVENLWSRLAIAFDYEPLLGDEYDGMLPVYGPGGIEDQVEYFIHKTDLEVLWDQLFPHGLERDSLSSVGPVLVLIQLHAALEAYVKALGISVKGGLPAAIQNHFRGNSLPSDVVDVLRDFDAVRHIWIHNSGAVDESFLRRVHASQFEIGELRKVSARDIDRYAATAYSIAQRLRARGNAAA